MNAREPEIWERFIAHVARARAKPSFDQEEREYRLEIAERLRGMLDSLGEGFITPQLAIETVFVGAFAGRPYRLTAPAQNKWLASWAAADEQSLADALRTFTAAEDAPEVRFDRFVEIAGRAGDETVRQESQAMVVPVGSLFNFAIEPESLPIVLPGIHRGLARILGIEPMTGPTGGPTGLLYRDCLAFARELAERMEESGITIRDMVDVQSLINLAVEQRALWADVDGPMPSVRARSNAIAWPRRRHGPPHYLSICGIFRDEAVYLGEWIEFHRLVGVEKFYLYDNLSSDDYMQVLEPYIEEGIVLLHDWPVYPAGQPPAYDHCLEHHRHDSRWIAFIDVDEFLFSPTGEPVPRLLESYEDFPAVGVGIALFGASGHRARPDGLVIESYTKRFYTQDSRSIKSIVDPTRTLRCASAHHFDYEHLMAVDENGYPITGTTTQWVSFSRLRLNHYWTKSEQEFRAKCAQPMAANAKFRAWPNLVHDRWITNVPDTEVTRYAPAVRAAIAAQNGRPAAPAR